jgi:hypothetical protein
MKPEPLSLNVAKARVGRTESASGESWK